MTFSNKKISELQKENNYMKLFLADVALRESCYNCNFKLGNKYSDITLGDFWGVQSYYPEMYNKQGVSAVIVNTEKGNILFDSIKDKINYKECKLEDIVKGNPSLEKSSARPNGRDQFFSDINELSINELTKKYQKKKSIFKRIIRKIKSIIKKLK